MRTLLLFFPAMLGCHAIVGDYEIEPRDAASDAVVDTRVEIDAASDAKLDTEPKGPTSCKAILAANSSAANGPYDIVINGEKLKIFCDMTGGGFTLVAARSATTAGTVWEMETGVSRVKELLPETPGDAVLDIDWQRLDFTEVVYDLGSPESRITFKPNETQKGNARKALSMPGGGPDAERPDCNIGGMNVRFCKPPPPPPGDSAQSFGWVYSPKGVLCYWAYRPANGAAECTGGTTVKARVFVR